MKEKAKRFIEKYRMLGGGEKILVGVSGGPDSVCLFYILKELQAEYNLKLHIVHLNHKLRSSEVELHAQNGILIEDVRFGTAFSGNGAPRELDINDVPNIYLNTESGIKLVADTVNYTAGQSTRLVRVYDCNIELNSSYGINIGAGVYRTLIRDNVSLHNNTLGNVLNNGVQTSDFSKNVWEELAADHLTAGTIGKEIDVIKTDIARIKAIEQGRWKRDDAAKTLTFYDAAAQPVTIFDLKDKFGNPSSTNVFERIPQ